MSEIRDTCGGPTTCHGALKRFHAGHVRELTCKIEILDQKGFFDLPVGMQTQEPGNEKITQKCG